MASKSPETRPEAWDRFSLMDSEGTSPTDTSIWDFWPPELGEDKFLVFNPSGLWSFCYKALAN